MQLLGFVEAVDEAGAIDVAGRCSGSTARAGSGSR